MFNNFCFFSGGGAGGGFSSGGGYAGGSAGRASGSAYRAPSGTLGRFSGSPGVARSSAARPQARIPAASQSYPTRVHYTTTYNNYGSGSRGFGSTSLLAAGGIGLIGGYALGSMMSRSYHPGYYGG